MKKQNTIYENTMYNLYTALLLDLITIQEFHEAKQKLIKEQEDSSIKP